MTAPIELGNRAYYAGQEQDGVVCALSIYKSTLINTNFWFYFISY